MSTTAFIYQPQLVLRAYASQTPIDLNTLLREVTAASACIVEAPRKEKPDRSYTLGGHIVVEYYKKFTVVARCEDIGGFITIPIKLNDVIIVRDTISNVEIVAYYSR